MAKTKKTLGAEICIPENAKIIENGRSYKKQIFMASVSVLIGIGRDHVAELVMDTDAWEELKKIKKVDITVQ